MTDQILCPICEEGHLRFECEDLEAEYFGHKALLPSHFAVCNACGSETATAEQARENKRGMIAFKKEVDGYLTGKEIIALRRKLGITQAQAAKIFGGGPVAFSKYEKDDVTQSESMDKLLKVANNFPMVAVWLARQSDEGQVAFRISNEHSPSFDVKPFVKQELKVSVESRLREQGYFRYTKLEKSRSASEGLLNVG